MKRKKCDRCKGRFEKSELVLSDSAEGLYCTQCADFIRKDSAVFAALLELL